MLVSPVPLFASMIRSPAGPYFTALAARSQDRTPDHSFLNTPNGHYLIAVRKQTERKTNQCRIGKSPQTRRDGALPSGGVRGCMAESIDLLRPWLTNRRPQNRRKKFESVIIGAQEAVTMKIGIIGIGIGAGTDAEAIKTIATH